MEVKDSFHGGKQMEGVYTSLEGAQAIIVLPRRQWVRVLPVLPVVPRLVPPSSRQQKQKPPRPSHPPQRRDPHQVKTHLDSIPNSGILFH